jgi:magnesium transporter
VIGHTTGNDSLIGAKRMTGVTPRTRVYRDGKLTAEGFPVDDISEHLRDENALVWFDLCDPDPDELKVIGEELSLHALAVDAAIDFEQRPKLVRFEKHLLLTCSALHLDPESGEVSTCEVVAFITHNALVTVRRSDEFDIDEVLRRWDASPDLTRYGVSFLLYGLIDYVVDTHFDALQSLDGELDALEERIFDDRPQEKQLQRRTFQLRKSLLTLRRVVLPMREVVNSVLRRDLHTLNEAMTPYFQDVYDHVLRVTEWTDSLRDFVGTILETQLTVRGNRLNVIMKQVTSWAAIIAVPTAITGFYGQNLPYPGSGTGWGVLASTGLIAVMSTLLYAVFKRKDWL